MYPHQRCEARQFFGAGGRQFECMSAPIGRRTPPHQQVSRLEPVEDRHQSRTVDAQRPRQRHLAEACVARDENQQTELAGREAGACSLESGGEVGEHCRLGAAQHVAQQRRQDTSIQHLGGCRGCLG